jgi:hypothetical protein
MRREESAWVRSTALSTSPNYFVSADEIAARSIYRMSESRNSEAMTRYRLPVVVVMFAFAPCGTVNTRRSGWACLPKDDTDRK